jgi:hypothetical protein
MAYGEPIEEEPVVKKPTPSLLRVPKIKVEVEGGL